jgi:hypothetical protein
MTDQAELQEGFNAFAGSMKARVPASLIALLPKEQLAGSLFDCAIPINFAWRKTARFQPFTPCARRCPKAESGAVYPFRGIR